MKESQFQEKVIKFLNSLDNTWHVKIWGGGFMRAGIPDIIACINGRFVAIELKADTGIVSELQKRNINLITESKGIGMILYPKGFEKFKKEISSLSKLKFNVIGEKNDKSRM
ncbi:hypothetical protein [Clostridium botulinum]|uniref:hypothetical protein n=1 Tax=Clostridium botulinum TaxID=1491 RepID=UPI0006A71F36|nr:hypothetical protein [Clostridium botulinum]KAI3350124.1 VRR-NUC domain-containing protein [Clostridium botulinum]KOM88942.1 hypothetical protein ACP51_04190 [Clostridium botulinum]KOR63508.1 hypothetical protein ADT22_02975 [Clostridium botulinum]